MPTGAHEEAVLGRGASQQVRGHRGRSQDGFRAMRGPLLWTSCRAAFLLSATEELLDFFTGHLPSDRRRPVLTRSARHTNFGLNPGVGRTTYRQERARAGLRLSAEDEDSSNPVETGTAAREPTLVGLQVERCDKPRVNPRWENREV